MTRHDESRARGADTGTRRQGWRTASPAHPVALATLAAALALALAAVPDAARGQQRPITGTVTHRETAAPLPGVFVALESRRSSTPVASTLTDGSGRFTLGGIEGRRYRVRFQRVGMTTEQTEWFTLGEERQDLRITLAERAVELEGFEVSTSARTCGLGSDEAVVVQRWWDEVRKALEVASEAGVYGDGRMRIERFERELAPNLRLVGSERSLGTESIVSASPFRALDPDILAEQGFVQGEDGSRVYLAPDAAVLFSDPFLQHHCLAIADDEDVVESPEASGTLHLSVRPTRTTPTDIRGVLTIDTIAGELRSFDYRYVNLPDELPTSRAGGHLSFRYLPSGSWIVSDWWIRMPQIGLRREGSLVTEVTQVLAGYVERGGRVVAIGGEAWDPDRGLGRATVRGTVFDSLAMAPLADARVTVVGTRLSTRTEPDGRFTLSGVPAGTRRLAVYHASLNRAGLPSPTLGVTLTDGAVDSVRLVTPGFGTLSRLLCGEAVTDSAAILTGSILDAPAGSPEGAVDLAASWDVQGAAPGDVVNRRLEARSGSEGRYIACGLPADVPVELAVRAPGDEAWRSAGTLAFEAGRIEVQDLWPGDEARSVVRGRVSSADGERALGGARLALVTIRGDTVAATETDAGGAFTLDVPAAVGYRAVAHAPGHWSEASTPFTVDGGEVVALDIQLSPVPAEGTFELEELMVEVETAQRTLARRRLATFGTSPERLGRRWIGRAGIDSIAFAGGDPGVAIQSRGIPGVRVSEEERRGADPRLCILPVRPRSPCAVVVLDGVRIDPRTALSLDFRDMEGIAVLRPQEAMGLFGQDGRGGAVLLWSRSARR